MDYIFMHLIVIVLEKIVHQECVCIVYIIIWMQSKVYNVRFSI